MARSRSSFWATLFLFAAVCCLLLPTQVLSSSVDLSTTGVFESSMDPTQEVPPASLSAHTGSAKLLYTFSSRYLSWVIEHTVWDATGAHIHGPAAPGENADVVIDLGNPESPITGGTSLSEEQEKTLLEGLFYINVHSPSYPDGDIRGQIVRSKSQYNADLSGSQMVPPVTSNATGTATFTYDHTAQVLTFTITHNLTTARTAFLHGPAEKGKVANATTFRFPRANSPITGTFAFNTTDEVILFQNLFYVNITSESNPYGELRGQVTLTEEDDEGFSKKMSWWKIILVIIGVGAGVALLVAGGVFGYRVWKKKKDYKDQQKQFADPLLKA